MTQLHNPIMNGTILIALISITLFASADGTAATRMIMVVDIFGHIAKSSISC